MAEMPSVYGREIRTARKTHRCCECKREIQPGEKYHFHHGVWNGRGASYKHCEQCFNLADTITREMSGHWDSDEGIAFGGLGEVAREHGFGAEWTEIWNNARAGGEAGT